MSAQGKGKGGKGERKTGSTYAAPAASVKKQKVFADVDPVLRFDINSQSEKLIPYSTVTLFAKLRGWSTSVPLSTATW